MVDDKLYVTNPEEWLQETVNKEDLTCIIIFRGSWCKYDKFYLKKLGQFMKKEQVTMIAWTGEGIEGARKIDQELGLTTELGYAHVLGDESLALAKWLKEDELLPDLVIVTPEEAKVAEVVKAAGSSYPNGIVMPGMIWYAHHGNIVFQWCARMDPTAPVPCGPLRPDPSALWQQVTKRKHALDHGNAVMPSHGTDMKMCTTDAEVNLSNCAVL